MAIDIKAEFNKLLSERNSYLSEAQEIAELTIPSLQPRASSGSSVYGTGKSYNSNSVQKLKRPKSDAGARAVKSFAATLVSTLAPTNVRFFRLISDPELNLSESDDKIVADIFKMQERRVEMFFAKHSFHAFSNATMKRLLVEGNIGVKVDEQGFKLYPLRSIAVKRSFGKILSAIFEEEKTVPNPEKKGEYKTVCQYIKADYLTGEVWVQLETEDKAKRTDELASQYIITVSDVPTIDNYGRSFYSDHYGLLKSIDEAATALEEAQKNCSWNWLSYTGPSTIPVDRIAGIKNRQVVRLPSHTDVQWQGCGSKISDWQFIGLMLKEKEESIQYISAVGLVARAGSIQTATEVAAIERELSALTGTVSQVIAETFFRPIVSAVMDVLGIRESLRTSLMNEQGIVVDNETLGKLMQPIVVSGVPALAREQDAERMLNGIISLRNTFGDGILSIFDPRAVSKEFLDGLKLNTEGLLLKQDQGMMQQIPPEVMAQLPPEIQQLPPEQIMQYLQSQQTQQ